MSIEVRVNHAGEDDLADQLEDVIDALMGDIGDDARRIVPVDTGKLRDSIETHVERDGLKVVGVLSSDNEAAAPTEYGTSKMRAQPWARPSVTKNRH